MTRNSKRTSGPERGNADDQKESQSEPCGEYEVGRGRPPRHSRFRAGQSGNPKGRPKRSRNFKTVMKAVLEEIIEIREGERVRRVPRVEALVRSLMNRALRGDAKAVTAITLLIRSSGYEAAAGDDGNAFATVDDDALIEDFLQRNSRP